MVGGPPASDKRARFVGKTIRGRWFLEGLLGSGGVGAVYAASDLGSGAKAAVKLIDAEGAAVPEVVARFEREARIVSGIDSPFVVRVLDTGSDRGPVPRHGAARARICQQLARLGRAPAELAPFVDDVLGGLDAAHARGVVHRDLKPDNVFLAVAGGRATAKLLDFGTSRIDRPKDQTTPMSLTGRGKIVGTPHYLAPEQARGAEDVDGRADLYAVGAIVYECLAGRPPHVGRSWADVVVSATTTEPTDVRAFAPDASPAVAAFVKRALAREPAARFPSAAAMRAELRLVVPELAERAAPPSAPSSSARRAASAGTIASSATRLSAGGAADAAARAGSDGPDPRVRYVASTPRRGPPTWAIAALALALGAATAWGAALWLGR